MTTDPKNLPPPPCASLRQISDDAFYVVNEVVTRRLGHLPIAKVGVSRGQSELGSLWTPGAGGQPYCRPRGPPVGSR